VSLKPPVACRRCAKACAGGYCPECKPIVQKERPPDIGRRKFDHQREWKKLYDRSRWRHPQYGLQAACLRRDPVCRKCHRNPSTVADHIKDHRGDERLFWDIGNLQGLCKGCHNAKTGSEHGGKGYTPERPGLVDGKVVDYMTPGEIQ
jgi:5-methylcytosine-specific restriction protein A